jgi:trehalose 6-phosphate phosphatase
VDEGDQGLMTDLLLALDFDGTIAAISPDPDSVVIDPAAAAFIRDIAIHHATVAIVSGRDVDDLIRRTGDLPVYLAGSHGLEIRDPSGRMLREEQPRPISMDRTIEEEALRLGLRIERKKHSIALHWREAGEDPSVHRVIERFREWAAENALQIIDGRRVAEARLRGSEKQDAVRELERITRATRLVYAGDDLTDFDSLRYAAQRGTGIFVSSGERHAPDGVAIARSTAELLEQLRVTLT